MISDKKNEQLQKIELIASLGFPPKYLDIIGKILHKHDPLLLLSPISFESKYSFFSYAYSIEALGQQIIAHVDRNIFKYCFDFLKKNKNTVEQQKLSLAIITFFSMFSAKYDFCEDFLELYDSTKNCNMLIENIENWNSFIDLFNSNNFFYILDFIETGINNLPEIKTDKIDSKKIDENKLYLSSSCQSSYIHMLKMSLMQKGKYSGIDAFRKYYQWCITTYKVDLSCLYYAIPFFSNKKNHRLIHSNISTIKNISWDLSRISDWYRSSVENIKENRIINILITNDCMLKRIAKMFEYNYDENKLRPQMDYFVSEYFNITEKKK